MIRQSFYRDCYQKTGGWIPLLPLIPDISIGSFFQIQNTKVAKLGNIFELALVDYPEVENGILLADYDWKFSSGVNNRCNQTEEIIDSKGEVSLWSKQLLDFSKRGSFLFYGEEPEAEIITNWSDFEEDITIKLTQAEYAFRELYVISGIVHLSNWGLVIAGQPDAKLEVTAQLNGFDYFDILSHFSCRTQNSENIDQMLRNVEVPAVFFKARKLILKESKKDQLIRQLLNRTVPLTAAEMTSWLNTDLLNLVESNELNIASTLEYFDWVDMSLDDVEKLC